METNEMDKKKKKICNKWYASSLHWNSVCKFDDDIVNKATFINTVAFVIIQNVSMKWWHSTKKNGQFYQANWNDDWIKLFCK